MLTTSKKEDITHVGPNMKSVRELHGKTLQEVAPRIGISLAQLSLVEREQAEINENAFKRWLRLFFMEERALRGGVIAWSSFRSELHATPGRVVKGG